MDKLKEYVICIQIANIKASKYVIYVLCLNVLIQCVSALIVYKICKQCMCVEKKDIKIFKCVQIYLYNIKKMFNNFSK